MHSTSKEQFIQLIQSHQGLINSLCKAYYKSEEDFRDMRQEVLLQLWKAYANFRGDAKASTWIYRVSINTILSQKNKKRLLAEPIDEKYVEKPQAVYSDDGLQRLHQAIEKLRELDKAIVILYLEGYAQKEIAEILNLSSTNVSTRFARIKQALKKIFKTSENGFGSIKTSLESK